MSLIKRNLPQALGLFCWFGSVFEASAGAKILPVLNHPISDQSVWLKGQKSIELFSVFGTEAIDDQVVRFVSQFNLGAEPLVMDMALFSDRTPISRANFLSYVTSGAYTNSFIHRSVPGFVIQGGATRIISNSFDSIPTNPPILNEFGISNTLGTVSMAKVGGDPNSATSQWFVSVGANTDILDSQNEGFTVFGRMTRTSFRSAQIFNDPYDFPTFNYGGIYGELPLFYTHVLGNLDIDEFILFPSVSLVPIPDGEAGESRTLSYSVISNSNPGLLSATVGPGGVLLLDPVNELAGSVAIGVRATDSVGNIVDDTFVVNVTPSHSYDDWAANELFPNSQSEVDQNADRDEWNNLQEFAFLGDPMVVNAGGLSIYPTIAGASNDSKYLAITFPVRKFTRGLSYVVEVSSGLSGSWSQIWSLADGFGHARVVTAVDQDQATMVTIKDTVLTGSASKRFMRVRVTHTP